MLIPEAATDPYILGLEKDRVFTKLLALTGLETRRANVQLPRLE